MESPQERSTWYRKSFTKDYRTIYSQRDEAQARAEVDCVQRELGIRPGEQLLDLCCGFGRHLEAFLERGVDAVGVDLSLELLRDAHPSVGGQVVCADMRCLPFPDGGTSGGDAQGFSVVVNLFTSFGYFTADEDNLQAAREIARVLVRGGRLCMDLMNEGPTVRDLEARSERQLDEFHAIEERRFDAAHRRVEKRTTLLGKLSSTKKEYFESVRLFTTGEIVSLLAHAGLRVERMLGDFDGRPHADDSPRMIVLGTKL